MKKQFKLLFLLLFLLLKESKGQISPTVYYDFDSTNPLVPRVGSTNLSGGGTYLINSGGLVGKYVEWTTQQNSAYFTGQNVTVGGAISVQFLYRSTYNTASSDAVYWFRHSALNIAMSYPSLSIQAANGELAIKLENVGRGSWAYLNDGNWHHMCVVYNSTAGTVSFYLDGQSPSGFSRTVTANSNLNLSGNITLSHPVSYVQAKCQMDEVAVYLGALTPGQIQQNYLDALSGNHYSVAVTTPATVASITASVEPTEYADQNVTALTQLQTFPLPRYKRGNTLMKNFNWVDMIYFGDRFQPGISDATSVTTATNLNDQLSELWNYGIYGLTNSSVANWRNAFRTLANAHPERDFNIITLRAQINSNLKNQNLSSVYYLQNSSGQFLMVNGATTTTQKGWRPTTATSFYNTDGDVQKTEIESFINSGLTRPINKINENGEIIPIYYDSTVTALDPVVLADKNASGMYWKDYLSDKYFRVETESYRDRILASPQLSTTKWTEYSICGMPIFNYDWNNARKINSTFNSQYYSTPDFYVRYPNNWYFRQGAWHGLDWIQRSRYFEILRGDKLFSPFISPGWNTTDPTQDVAPAQWLGLLKILNMFGAEFYYTTFFNEAGNYSPPNPPPAKPSIYAWQLSAASYAQAITSQIEPFLRNGVLLDGDYPILYSEANAGINRPSYLFYCGDKQSPVAVRKMNGSNIYAIAGTVQRLTNQKNSNVNQKNVTISLGGNNVTFKIRQQGSTYIYDNTDVANPIFYQLDGWHDSTHYRLWDSDLKIEAEILDSSANTSLKTINYTGRNFTNASTYVNFGTGGKAVYDFQPRTTATRYLYIYARAADTTSNIGLRVYLDHVLKGTISCIKDTTWQWYKFNSTDSTAITFTSLNSTKHTLRLESVNNKVYVDKMVISTNANLYGTLGVTACGVAPPPPPPVDPIANISSNGSTSFCTGGAVTLTANTNGTTGISYLWSTGATTSSITVSTSGNYLVTVTSNLGVAVSPITTVNVYSSIQAVITAIPNTIECYNTPISLTATNGYSYLWSTGEISQTISVNTANSYTVTVNYGGNCKSTSAPLVVQYKDCSCSTPALTTQKIGTNYITFNYTKIGLSSYTLQLYKGNTLINTYNYSSQKTRTITGLLRKTTYSIRIRANCATTNSAWSNSIIFTTQ
jgi:hypothetical protein